MIEDADMVFGDIANSLTGFRERLAKLGTLLDSLVEQISAIPEEAPAEEPEW